LCLLKNLSEGFEQRQQILSRLERTNKKQEVIFDAQSFASCGRFIRGRWSKKAPRRFVNRGNLLRFDLEVLADFALHRLRRRDDRSGHLRSPWQTHTLPPR